MLLIRDGRVVERFEGGPSGPPLTEWLGEATVEPIDVAELAAPAIGG